MCEDKLVLKDNLNIDPHTFGFYLLSNEQDSELPYTRPKIVISGKYGIVNIDIKTKSVEPLTRVNNGCLHPIRDRCIVN